MTPLRRFSDRAQAGRLLGAKLAGYEWTDPIVLGLARGGVPVAAGVASALRAPLDVVVARKIGAPDQPELAVGAVTADGAYLYDDDMLDTLGLSRSAMEDRRAAEIAEARRRQDAYRVSERLELHGRDAILVDDGLATGLTALAAVRSVRGLDPRSITVAVPVASPPAVHRVAAFADWVYALIRPASFRAVGSWYRDFSQVTDEQVHALLSRV